jgi:hypothetical protein
MKKCSLESVRQISRQKQAKASVVRQPKKVYCEMIGMGDLYIDPLSLIGNGSAIFLLSWPRNFQEEKFPL